MEEKSEERVELVCNQCGKKKGNVRLWRGYFHRFLPAFGVSVLSEEEKRGKAWARLAKAVQMLEKRIAILEIDAKALKEAETTTDSDESKPHESSSIQELEAMTMKLKERISTLSQQTGGARKRMNRMDNKRLEALKKTPATSNLSKENTAKSKTLTECQSTQEESTTTSTNEETGSEMDTTEKKKVTEPAISSTNTKKQETHSSQPGHPRLKPRLTGGTK